MVRRVLTSKHDGIKIVPLPLKILSSKNRLGKFWNFDPWCRLVLDSELSHESTLESMVFALVMN